MLKVLLLSSILSLSATLSFADNPDPKHTSDPYLGYTDENPVRKTVVEIPLEKCSTDVSLINTLTDNGYNLFLQFQDMSRPEIFHGLFYSSEDNRFVLSHTIAEINNPKDILKVCIEYMGSNPTLEGKTFKKFILMNNIQEREKQIEEEQNKENEKDKKDHELYHGDPNKI